MLKTHGLRAGLVAILFATGTAQAAAPTFNGTWAIQLVTEQGSCDDRYDYAVEVQDGAAHLSDGGSATLTGGVGQNGVVVLTLTSAMATANASGQLRGNRGSGTWRVDGLGCSGHWTAARRA